MMIRLVMRMSGMSELQDSRRRPCISWSLSRSSSKCPMYGAEDGEQSHNDELAR